MPYFLASSVDAMISSTVIFLSMASRIACEPDSTPRLRRSQPARRISLSSSSPSTSTRVSQLHDELQPARADAAAQLDDALAVGGEGVVLDLEHLHGRPRDRAFSSASST